MPARLTVIFTASSDASAHWAFLSSDDERSAGTSAAVTRATHSRASGSPPGPYERSGDDRTSPDPGLTGTQRVFPSMMK
jgi:hypothetical protein